MFEITIVWNIPFFGRREETHTFSSYGAAARMMKSCQTSKNFVSAKINEYNA